MPKVYTSLNLRRRQLERGYLSKGLSEAPSFKRGYIRELREVLGLSSTNLARRLGVSQPAITQMEKSEAEGNISLNSLRKVAEAMDCSLVYALVPKTSLDGILTNKSRNAAEKIVKSVGHSMALEAQSISKEEMARQIDELAEELKRNLDRRLWE